MANSQGASRVVNQRCQIMVLQTPNMEELAPKISFVPVVAQTRKDLIMYVF
jgi:hypothetical protein